MKNSLPDSQGHFGIYGGRYVAETLMPLLREVEQAYAQAKQDQTFWSEYQHLLTHYVGRPSPLYFAKRLTEHCRTLTPPACGRGQGRETSPLNPPVNGGTPDLGAKIYFKRDELNHTGAHKINNCIGQILLARRMGKRRIIAETGAGQHGVATATVCALFGLKCIVYMGAKDIERQAPNVFRMKLLGAEIVPVESGSKTLKDAMNEALRDWVSHVDDTYYLIGTVAGPHPYPEMVRDFQAIIGEETREQMLAQEGREPDVLIASIGGGSNAIGLFYPFLDEPGVRMFGVEAGGEGIETGHHAASLSRGAPGVLHGSRSYVLQDEHGQVLDAHSISAGLDYPGVGPEHAYLRDSKRVEYVSITDREALDAFQTVARLEGILPALEPSHALAQAIKLAPTLPRDQLMVVNVCGRGDKDIFTVAKALGVGI